MTDDHPTRPSRESMREVKKEFKQRQRAERDRAKAAQTYWDAETGRATSGSRRSRGSGRNGATAALVAVVALGVVGASAVLHIGPFAPASSAASAPPITTAASTPTPSGTSTAASPNPGATDDGTDPTVVAAFQDSPARTWRSGTAGIVLPTARPGDWKAAAETRIRGKVSPTIDKDGSLRIAFTYVAAYWLVPSGGGVARTIAVRVEGGTSFWRRGSAHLTATNVGGIGAASSANVCGSLWAYPDFTEAWADPDRAPVTSAPPVTGSGDMSDPNATLPAGECFQDTSGFRS